MEAAVPESASSPAPAQSIYADSSPSRATLSRDTPSGMKLAWKELRQKARNATSGPLQIAAILLAASCILPPAARAIEPRHSADQPEPAELGDGKRPAAEHDPGAGADQRWISLAGNRGRAGALRRHELCHLRPAARDSRPGGPRCRTTMCAACWPRPTGRCGLEPQPGWRASIVAR